MPADHEKPGHREASPERREARDAQAALVGTIARMETWQNRTKVLQALVLRQASDRSSILAEAKSLRAQIVDARTDILMILADASAAVAGNSRVVDVEKALDTLDETLKQIERSCR
jgi:hypothetical protein